jgi:alkylation response protein AidB-like acyl-CoA dehydrogenase
LGPLVKYGNEKQIEEFVKPFLNGERIGCFALSEPGLLLPLSFDGKDISDFTM